MPTPKSRPISALMLSLKLMQELMPTQAMLMPIPDLEPVRKPTLVRQDAGKR